MRMRVEPVVPESNNWLRVVIGGGGVLLYAHFLAMATQLSRETSSQATVSGMEAMLQVIPFGVIGLWLLASVFSKSANATLSARLAAGVFVALFVAVTANCWASWNKL